MTPKPKGGGVQAVAEMLNLLEPGHRKRLLESVSQRDPELALRIEKEMFVFEDLSRLSVRDLQALLREIPPKTLLLALKTTSGEFRERIYSGVSSRTAQLLREEFENQGLKRRSDVTAAQAEVIRIARGLEARGKVNLKPESGDPSI